MRPLTASATSEAAAHCESALPAYSAAGVSTGCRRSLVGKSDVNSLSWSSARGPGHGDDCSDGWEGLTLLSLLPAAGPLEGFVGGRCFFEGAGRDGSASPDSAEVSRSFSLESLALHRAYGCIKI